MLSLYHKELDSSKDQLLPKNVLKKLIINGFKMTPMLFVEKFFYYVVCSNAIESVTMNGISAPKDCLRYFFSMVAPCSDDKDPNL